MTRYQILYWHGIPTQVRARENRARVSKELPSRFMEAVDKAAMIAKRIEGDAYMDGFAWGDWQERDGSAEEVVSAVAGELDAQYPEIDYRAIGRRLKEEGEDLGQRSSVLSLTSPPK